MIKGLLIALAFASVITNTNAEVIAVGSGKLEGERVGDVVRYMGVPYAQPPVGELRWRAPRPAKPWKGIKKALKPGSACMQVGNFFASADESTFDKPYGSEDCLYLNAWKPLKRGGPRPVLVFFHGGSGIVGNSAHPLYDGARLAKELDAVVVTANYRLSIWGSLQSHALKTGDPLEDSGSFYLLDMIRVLDWLRENCSALNCDADNITISGQSAGAVAVLALLRSPPAAGKFKRAVSLSGLPFSSTNDQAIERADEFIKNLIVEDGSAANKEEAAEHLSLKTQSEVKNYLYSQTPEAMLKAAGFGLSPQAVDDGAVLVKLDKPVKMAPEAVNSVPLLIGTTRNELTTLVPINDERRSVSKLWPLFNGEPREESINQQLGWFKGILRDTKIKFAGWFLNRKFKTVVDRYAEKLPAVYVYQFNWDNYPEPWKSEFGSFHGLDIPFFFGNFINDKKIYMRFAWTEENRQEREILHQRMIASLSAFIRDGNPSTDEVSWPSWKDSKTRMIWGRQ